MSKRFGIRTLAVALTMLTLGSVRIDAQDLTLAQRQERCANNNVQLDQLRPQADLIERKLWYANLNEDNTRDLLSRLNRALGERSALPAFRSYWAGLPSESRRAYATIIGALEAARPDPDPAQIRSLRDGTIRVIQRIKLYKPQRAQLLQQQSVIDQEIAIHETRRRELRCDELSSNVSQTSKESSNASKNQNLPSVVGTWKWAFAKTGDPVEHGTVTFSDDGTMSWSGGNSGTWKQVGYVVTLEWTNPPGKDTMVLQADFTGMAGNNGTGWKVKGTRKKQ